MVGWHHWLNGHKFEQTWGDSEARTEAWNAAVHGVTKSWTQLSNWTTTSELVQHAKVLINLIKLTQVISGKPWCFVFVLEQFYFCISQLSFNRNPTQSALNQKKKKKESIDSCNRKARHMVILGDGCFQILSQCIQKIGSRHCFILLSSVLTLFNPHRVARQPLSISKFVY